MRLWTIPVSMGLACQDDAGTAGDAAPTGESGGYDTVVGDCSADQPMSLMMGSGESAFTQLAEGDPVTVVHGPQGGWHVDVAGFVEHSAQNVSIVAVITALDAPTPSVIAGAEGEPAFVALAAYDDISCSGTFWGLRSIVDDVIPPEDTDLDQIVCTLRDQRVEIATTLTEILDPEEERAPRTVSSSIEAIAAIGPDDAAEFCF